MKLVKNLKISTQDKLILTISPKAFVHIASTASACQSNQSVPRINPFDMKNKIHV